MKVEDLLNEKDFFLIDIRGTIMKSLESGHVFDDAKELIRFLREKGKCFVLLTNAERVSSKYLAYLATREGLEISSDEIINPTKVAVWLLRKELEGIKRVYLIGEQGHVEDLSAFDNVILTRVPPVDVVFIGTNRFLTYKELIDVARIINKYNPIVMVLGTEEALEMDGPYGDGIYLFAGAFGKMLESALGRKFIFVGKPNNFIFDYAMELLGARKETTLMIGDRIETDAIGASEYGIDALIVVRGKPKKVKTPFKTRIFVAKSLRVSEEIEEIRLV